MAAPQTNMVPQTIILSMNGRLVGPIKSFEGGGFRGGILDESIGTRGQRRISAIEIAPFSMEIGAMPTDAVLQWIGASLRGEYDRRTLSISTLTAGKWNYELDGYEGLLTETTMPTLDRRSNADVFIKIKVQVERETRREFATPGAPQHAPPLNPLSGSEFRFTIDHVLPGGQEVQRVESFTNKQGVKKLYTGHDRSPQIEPTRLDFPNVIFTLPAVQAGELLKWYEQVTASSARSLEKRNGRIEFFSRGKSLVMGYDLYDVGLVGVSTIGGQVKAEIYCSRMDVKAAA